MSLVCARAAGGEGRGEGGGESGESAEGRSVVEGRVRRAAERR